MKIPHFRDFLWIMDSFTILQIFSKSIFQTILHSLTQNPEFPHGHFTLSLWPAQSLARLWFAAPSGEALAHYSITGSRPQQYSTTVPNPRTLPAPSPTTTLQPTPVPPRHVPPYNHLLLPRPTPPRRWLTCCFRPPHQPGSLRTPSTGTT